jgi:hypothetical protein
MADFTRCRTYGHSWVETMDSTWKPEMGVPLTLRCERCTTERRDAISQYTGQLMYRSYAHPEGYRYARGEKPTIEEFRVQLLALRIQEARQRRKESA